MKFTIRDGMWLTVVIFICLAWFADHGYSMACWALSERHVAPGLPNPGSPNWPADASNLGLGPYEQWAQEMENSDRLEPRPTPGFIHDEIREPRPSPFARIDELISRPQTDAAKQR